MSFYNTLFGSNPLADLILATLKLTRQETGRFRDCFVAEGEIAIYTRNGGGNREDYEEVFVQLSRHPNYLRDQDDDFDCTYATIYFSFPSDYKDILDKLDSGKFEPSKKWLEAIDSIGKPGYEPPEQIVKLMQSLKTALDEGKSKIIEI